MNKSMTGLLILLLLFGILSSPASADSVQGRIKHLTNPVFPTGTGSPRFQFTMDVGTVECPEGELIYVIGPSDKIKAYYAAFLTAISLHAEILVFVQKIQVPTVSPNPICVCVGYEILVPE